MDFYRTCFRLNSFIFETKSDLLKLIQIIIINATNCANILPRGRGRRPVNYFPAFQEKSNVIAKSLYHNLSDKIRNIAVEEKFGQNHRNVKIFNCVLVSLNMILN